MGEKELQERTAAETSFGSNEDVGYGEQSVAATQKSRWERSWPVIACGSGEQFTMGQTRMVFADRMH